MKHPRLLSGLSTAILAIGGSFPASRPPFLQLPSGQSGAVHLSVPTSAPRTHRRSRYDFEPERTSSASTIRRGHRTKPCFWANGPAISARADMFRSTPTLPDWSSREMISRPISWAATSSSMREAHPGTTGHNSSGNKRNSMPPYSPSPRQNSRIQKHRRIEELSLPLSAVSASLREMVMACGVHGKPLECGWSVSSSRLAEGAAGGKGKRAARAPSARLKS